MVGLAMADSMPAQAANLGQARPSLGELCHEPVLLEEAIEVLAPERGGTFLDGTFGAGGYSLALAGAGAGKVIAIDRDPEAVRRGLQRIAETDAEIVLHHACFDRLAEIAAQGSAGPLDGVVLDLGMSSMQLADPDRGFSIRHSGPLDMRMSREGLTAGEIVNGAQEAELVGILATYGEERSAKRIVRAILREREQSPIETTERLAAIVADAVSVRRPGRIHPATRTFQALRIVVNDEIRQLLRALSAAESALAPGGVLCVVSFHSLEDRIVKHFLSPRVRTDGGHRHLPVAAGKAPSFGWITQGAVRPAPEEVARNPRARSARLRAARRTESASHCSRSGISEIPDFSPDKRF